jgi:hypothetical protein
MFCSTSINYLSNPTNAFKFVLGELHPYLEGHYFSWELYVKTVANCHLISLEGMFLIYFSIGSNVKLGPVMLVILDF